MREVTHVKAHVRRRPEKSPRYISTHLSLLRNETDKIAFAKRCGVEVPADRKTQRQAMIDRFLPWLSIR